MISIKSCETGWYICLGVSVATMLVMSIIERWFYKLEGGVKRRFKMLQMEFIGNRATIVNLISKINALGKIEAYSVLGFVRVQLYIDFVFMAGLYPGVYFATRLIAPQAPYPWAAILTFLGCLQPLAFLLDVTENVYLLKQLRNPRLMPLVGFIFYWVLEILKWGIPVTALLIAALIKFNH